MARSFSLCIDRQLLKDRTVPLTARVVFAQLLDHRNAATGQCNPKMRTLGDELGLTRWEVLRAMEKLRKMGWIKATRHTHTLSYTIERDVQNCTSQKSESAHHDVQNCTSGSSGPLYEPIQGEVRARAKRAAAFPSQDQIPRKPARSAALEIYYAEERRRAERAARAAGQ